MCPGFCGDNSLCQFANHNPICSCKPGYQGNADVGCSSVPVIADPCVPSPCGAEAVCELDNGNPICSCPRGKTGNPFVRCITGELILDYQRTLNYIFWRTSLNFTYVQMVPSAVVTSAAPTPGVV